jgi:hypothetical protein
MRSLCLFTSISIAGALPSLNKAISCSSVSVIRFFTKRIFWIFYWIRSEPNIYHAIVTRCSCVCKCAVVIFLKNDYISQLPILFRSSFYAGWSIPISYCPKLYSAYISLDLQFLYSTYRNNDLEQVLPVDYRAANQSCF